MPANCCSETSQDLLRIPQLHSKARPNPYTFLLQIIYIILTLCFCMWRRMSDIGKVFHENLKMIAKKIDYIAVSWTIQLGRTPCLGHELNFIFIVTVNTGLSMYRFIQFPQPYEEATMTGPIGQTEKLWVGELQLAQGERTKGQVIWLRYLNLVLNFQGHTCNWFKVEPN